MRTILFLIQKEFIQVFRNRTMLPIIFVVPLVQLIILVYAANLEMKQIRLSVVDNDLSGTSREMVSKIEGSEFYSITSHTNSLKEASLLLHRNEIEAVLVIPHHFEKSLIKEGKSEVQLIINAINTTVASLVDVYSTNIIKDYNIEFIKNYYGKSESVQSPIQIEPQYWYNPKMNYKIYMIPGILVILVTLIGMFLTALNLVREKEIGTMEQINVTPIKKYQFLMGKLIPFWIIALFELGFGLTLGYFMFDLPIKANLFLIFGFAGVYLIVALGIGLFISTITNTQQQVMFISWFFMLTFILMSGIFTPQESMPQWAQHANIINPFSYFMRSLRMMLLKGSSFSDISKDFYALLAYGSTILMLAVWRYRKTN